ncbi:MAG: hypothetical protein FJ109_07640 [Deltaproteobacteria bacterium]|nr:hypothetical protein [Deltaproteobacteria bacterium]
MKTLTGTLVLVAAVFGPALSEASAQETPSTIGNGSSASVLPPGLVKKSSLPRQVDFTLELANLFVIRNDGDFDRSDPTYGKYGQPEGFLATFLHPYLGVRLAEQLRFFYETEIGMDLWSEKNPDVWLGLEDSRGLSIKQREIWGELTLNNWYVKAGFQRMLDSTGLFVNHWIGAVRAGYGLPGESRIVASFGQFPDQTHEGWTWGQTFGDFRTDVLLSALDGTWVFGEMLALDCGAYYVRDGSRVDMLRQVGAAAMALRARGGAWDASLGVVTQFGRGERSAEGGAAGAGAGGADAGSAGGTTGGQVDPPPYDASDAGIFGWAAEARASGRFSIVTLKGGLAAMSADDAFEGNDALGFLWSGKRGSRSLLLSENETRDIGDNVDEKMGTFDGWFYEMRTGLMSADLGLYVDPLKWLTVGAVTEVMAAVNPDNALGNRFAGWESELLVDLHLLEGAFQVQLVGGMLVPGGAASAYVNAIDVDATDTMFFGQTAVLMYF